MKQTKSWAKSYHRYMHNNFNMINSFIQTQFYFRWEKSLIALHEVAALLTKDVLCLKLMIILTFLINIGEDVSSCNIYEMVANMIIQTLMT